MPAAVSDELKIRSQDFAFILYPNEDSNHRKLLDYVSSHDRLFKSVWIEHDKDVLEDGSIKKHHVHLLVHTSRRWTVSSLIEFFGGWIDFIQPIYSPDSYIAYMCHDTPNSCHKTPYSPDLLHGDKKLISKVFGQNPYFVQLGEFAEQCRQGANISDIIIDSISIHDNSKRSVAFETFNKYSHVICCMSNQEKNDIKERNRKNADAINNNDFDTEFYPQMKVGDFIES